MTENEKKKVVDYEHLEKYTKYINSLVIEQSSGIKLDTPAEVGQILSVKEVDDDGKPTKWEVVDKPSGGDTGVTSAISVIKLQNSGTAYAYKNGSIAVLDNEIHLLGSGESDANKYHYKWDGTQWISVSTLPFSISRPNSTTVLDNEIHFCYSSIHYKWDGTSWTSVSTLPYTFYNCCVITLNNEIHVLGGNGNSDNYAKHYKWDGTSWSSVSTLPYNLSHGSAVVYNNEIHILGGFYNPSIHYKWDGTSWTRVSSLPYPFHQGSALTLDNEIHILGSAYSSNTYKYHYKWDGTSWTRVSSLPYDFYYGSAVSIDNQIFLFGGGEDNSKAVMI